MGRIKDPLFFSGCRFLGMVGSCYLPFISVGIVENFSELRKLEFQQLHTLLSLFREFQHLHSSSESRLMKTDKDVNLDESPLFIGSNEINKFLLS
jgi:hypothetical protein